MTGLVLQEMVSFFFFFLGVTLYFFSIPYFTAVVWVFVVFFFSFSKMSSV